MARLVAVVAHTHWDREWHIPYERFRARLVEVVDEVLAILERDPAFAWFLFDGQMAMIDDYLEVRPAAAGTIRRLGVEGRLSIGPWYVLMDEFCVSGETLVRNLRRGMRRAEEFGGSMLVGYLPDMFGHVAQMPQLLHLAGIDQAVVWRGVPAAVDRTAFWWEAPDGSTVRAEYLPVGYANGAYLPDSPDALWRRMSAHEEELSSLLADAATPILLMNGTDQQRPQAGLPDLLAGVNQLQDRFHFRQMALPDFLAGAPRDLLPRWRGELRSGARANLLMGVLSNRVDIKVAAAVAEREIERLAEPLAVLWLPPEAWPADLLDEAWLALIHNSAHDSVCGCSADAVGRAVRHRYDAATALAAEVTERALALAAVATDTGGPVIINPGPAEASGTVELVLPGTGPVTGAQVLERVPAGVEGRAGTGVDFARFIGELSAAGWLPGGRPVDAEIHDGDDALEISLVADASRRPSLGVASVMAEAWARAGARRHSPLRVRVERRPTQRVAARVSGVPGYGWKTFAPTPLDGTAVGGGHGWLENARVRVEVDPDDGTLSVNGLAGLGRLVDDGDEGDTYNHSGPGVDTVVDRPERVGVELIESGPVRATLRVTRHFVWPLAVEGGRRVGRRRVEVVSDVQLHAGEELIRVVTCFDNPSRDHRLRAWFPLPRTADHSVAECAFATVRRGPAEGGPHEPALATYPARRFVTAGGLTLTHEGLLEYELVDGGSALALTLLRCTGVLSRPAPAARPNPAGPADRLEAPQMLGPRRLRYALALTPVNPWRLADTAWLPLRPVSASGTGRLPTTGSRLVVRGAEVSALRRAEGDAAIELRVFNPTAEPARVEVPGHTGWLVDLRGRRLERWQAGFALPPWTVATARLDASALDR